MVKGVDGMGVTIVGGASLVDMIGSSSLWV